MDRDDGKRLKGEGCFAGSKADARMLCIDPALSGLPGQDEDSILSFEPLVPSDLGNYLDGNSAPSDTKTLYRFTTYA